MLTAITGINWGDEGKGRMVDLLSKSYDIVVRYQGGNNAGHTVVNEKGKFILNLLPSGILREDVVNVMGNGMVIDIEHLVNEIENLRKGGINVTPDNLKISERAVICMPYHKLLDCYEEDRLADAKYGSTRRGIAPVYGDKYMKKALRLGDLFQPETTKKRLEGILEYKNLTITKIYNKPAISLDEMWQWLEKYGEIIKPYVCDSALFLDKAAKEGKNIMFEAQLGALRDIDFGIYPYTSSSNVIGAYAPVGAGVPNHKVDLNIGIMKAYSSCVGEGPFTCELFGEEAEKLRNAGGEFGAATGRPRRVGPFDVVASKYGCRAQGADVLALTKLDILDTLDEIPVTIAYELDGKEIHEFPYGDALERAKPINIVFKGWQKDLTGCRKKSDLPKEAVEYIDFIEKSVGVPVKYISVGAERDMYIEV